MVRRTTRPTFKLTGAPFEGHGAQRLNRHKRRVAAGRFRRGRASADPLTVFLRTKQGLLWIVGGGLLFATALYGMHLARM